MFNRRGEITTIIILSTLAVIGIATLISSTVTQQQNTLNTRAEFEGSMCNDDIHDTLNSTGATSFKITCWGDLNKRYKFVVNWCPDLAKGATYCAGQVLESSEGSIIPSSFSKSTDKTCGCVSWGVTATNAAGQEGIAGGAIFCTDNPCETGTQPTSTTNPTPTQKSLLPTVTNTPTKPPVQNTPINTPTLSPTTKPTSTPTITKCSGNLVPCPGTNLCVPALVECEPTPTSNRVQITLGVPPSNTPTSTRTQVILGVPPSVTPTRVQVALGVPPNDTPTPAPKESTIIRSTTIKTTTDINGKACIGDPSTDYGCIDIYGFYIK